MYPMSMNKSILGWRERFRYQFEADAAWKSYANIKASQNTKSVVSRLPCVGSRTE